MFWVIQVIICFIINYLVVGAAALASGVTRTLSTGVIVRVLYLTVLDV
jgi:TM2 domain-containing membrane protein YozV